MDQPQSLTTEQQRDKMFKEEVDEVLMALHETKFWLAREMHTPNIHSIDCSQCKLLGIVQRGIDAYYERLNRGK